MNELDSSAIIRDLEMLLDQLYYWAKRARESRSTSDDDGLGGRGRRKDGPFVAVNCAAMPEPLLESELFGHVRGAFTDARAARTGLFVQAHRGTLLLDEIGDLPLALQPKLLRALQERVVRPIGGNEEVPFDVHLVATTNRDLESAVEEGRFREDLYFRVNVIYVEMPPLRARGSDVLLLAQHFLVHHAGKAGKHVSALSPEAAERLLAYAWPGNVRELQNAMERAVALARYDQVTVDDLPEKVRAYPGWWRASAGTRRSPPGSSGSGRKTLYRKLVQYGASGE